MESGGIEALLQHLSHASETVQVRALEAVANIVDICTLQELGILLKFTASTGARFRAASGNRQLLRLLIASKNDRILILALRILTLLLKDGEFI